MHDGRTRKVDSPEPTQRHDFLATHEASLTILAGPLAGTEFELKGQRQIAGRSDGVAIRIEHESVSAEHAAFELGEDGFGVRDLASTNGVRVNGVDVLSTALEHGDRIELGACEMQYVVQSTGHSPKTWSVD